MKVARAGGVVSALTGAQTAVVGIAVDADYLFWTSSAGSVKRVTK